jgi:hypothetical protein
MKLLDLLKQVYGVLNDCKKVPPYHTGEVTIKLQVNQGGVRDGQVIISTSVK